MNRPHPVALFRVIILVACAALARAAEPRELRVGIIGLDTSHVSVFSRLLNDASDKDHIAGAKVVAAFKGGSPDVTASASRVDGYTKKTLGLIRPGTYHFNTGAPERMEIIGGSCQVILDDTNQTSTYEAGTHFDVPGNSGFTIAVAAGLCEYICSFLAAK